MPRFWLISVGALALGLGCTHGPSRASQASDSGAPPRWSYEIRIDETLERMQLGLCIEGRPPQQLITADNALEFVRSATVREGPALARSERGLLIETLGEHGCVDLEIDLAAVSQADGSDTLRSGDTLLLGPGHWLWYPDDVGADVDARARFELPEGVAVTVPWAREADGWRRLDRSSFDWGAWVAIGRYEPIVFRVGQCEFEVAVLDGERASSDAGIETWLRVAAEVSAELYGRFPRERVCVVVIPRSGWGNAPVQFGMVRRGGGASVMLLLDQAAEDRELVGEWVASHEFLHLGMPWVKDPWMGEGFVTYYSSILSARRDVFVQDAPHERQVEAALEDLLDGFGRGRGGPEGDTLARASETMRSSHAYGRVYWGGAAVAFDLDLRIRRATANRRSLDDLVRPLAVFAPEHRVWSASEVIVHMDTELRRWHAAGELDSEISVAEIVAGHLEATSIFPHIRQLEGLAVELDSGRVRLLAEPSEQARTRTRLFEPSDVEGSDL